MFISEGNTILNLDKVMAVYYTGNNCTGYELIAKTETGNKIEIATSNDKDEIVDKHEILKQYLSATGRMFELKRSGE